MGVVKNSGGYRVVITKSIIIVILLQLLRIIYFFDNNIIFIQYFLGVFFDQYVEILAWGWIIAG